MPRIRPKQKHFNDLPLWEGTRKRHLRELPLPARRVAQRFGCEPEFAELIARLAGMTGDRP
jgi:hypothetical protein